MNSFIVFTKKEFMEHIRTKKFLIMIIIMIFCAFISAPTAKYLPEIFKSVLAEMTIQYPEPTYLDGYAQFFKNISQLGLFILIFILAGSVSKEKYSGSAVIVLTKPLTRRTMVLSKFLVTSLLFTVSYFVAYGIHLLYSWLLFEEIGTINAFISVLMLWFYCIFIIAITAAASSICRKSLTAGIMSFVIFFILSILSSLPILSLDKLSPGVLASVNTVVAGGNVGKEVMNGLTKQMQVVITWSQIGISALITLVLIAAFLAVGIIIFEKQEL